MAGGPRSAEVIAPRTHPSGRSDTAVVRLVERCRDREELAWVELVTRYERLVYGVALREGLDGDDAADVTQTVFEALFTAIPTLREEERLSSWLYSVARRQAWRARDRRRRDHDSLTLGENPPDRTAAHDPAADVDRALALHEALQELGEPCRKLLTALYFDPAEPSYADVAVRLGRPVGSIGPSRGRCLQHLRALMRNGGWR